MFLLYQEKQKYPNKTAPIHASLETNWAVFIKKQTEAAITFWKECGIHLFTATSCCFWVTPVASGPCDGISHLTRKLHIVASSSFPVLLGFFWPYIIQITHKIHRVNCYDAGKVPGQWPTISGYISGEPKVKVQFFTSPGQVTLTITVQGSITDEMGSQGLSEAHT